LLIISVSGPRLGLGKHVQIVPGPDIQKLLISLYVGQIVYAIGLTIIKISILLLYRSLFPTRGMRLATNIIVGVCLAWGVESSLVGILSCLPVNAFWDSSIKNAHCINTNAFFIANSTPNVFIDIIILVLPVRKVFALKMVKRQKIVVTGMFSLGGM
jgi:hypothetical protein